MPGDEDAGPAAHADGEAGLARVAEGRFRADLFYRLNVFPLALRPLRERAEDIAPLAFALLLRHAPKGKTIPWISDAALAMLKLHGWAGNVRELENVVRRALLVEAMTGGLAGFGRAGFSAGRLAAGCARHAHAVRASWPH